MVVQLLQLLAAGWSPGAADEYQHRSPGAERVCEPKFLAIAGLQCKQRCHVSNPEADHCSGHPCSSTSDSRRLQAYYRHLSYAAHRVHANTLVAVASPLPPAFEYAMFVVRSSDEAAVDIGLPRFLARR
jgi:hypothetical protein